MRGDRPNFLKSSTGELFKDPVVDSSGDSHERATLKNGIPNYALKNIIDAFEKKPQDICGQDAKVVPGLLCCPISQTLLRQPVITQEGQTYSRKALDQWIAERRDSQFVTDPMTRGPLNKNPKYRPNNNLAALIVWWEERNPCARSLEGEGVEEAKEQPTRMASRSGSRLFGGARAATPRYMEEVKEDPEDILRRLQRLNQLMEETERLHSTPWWGATHSKQQLEKQFRNGIKRVLRSVPDQRDEGYMESLEQNEQLFEELTNLIDQVYYHGTSAELVRYINCSPELLGRLRMNNSQLKQLFAVRWIGFTSQTHVTVKRLWDRARRLPTSKACPRFFHLNDEYDSDEDNSQQQLRRMMNDADVSPTTCAGATY